MWSCGVVCRGGELVGQRSFKQEEVPGILDLKQAGFDGE